MKVVIIDNYDSFTYNLSHLVKELGAEVSVLRNDCFSLPELEQFDKIILSPGPGIPSEAGLLLDVIGAYAGRKPILGVCLGHQAIGEYFGGRLTNLSDVFHGVQTPVSITADDYLFASLPATVERVTRSPPKKTAYLSTQKLIKKEQKKLERKRVMREQRVDVTARPVRQELDVRGIQFHPESVLTPDGRTMIGNWLAH